MRKTRGVNPKCHHCNSPHTIKNKLVYKNTNQGYSKLVGSFKCKDCNKYFQSSAYLPYIVDTDARCHHCKLGVACHKSCKHRRADGTIAQSYICSNCKRAFTPKLKPDPRIKRKLTTRQILDLRNEGLSYRAIAQSAGVSPTSIWRYLGREYLD